ncbi:hypothetical protein [Streptomyces hayashii]|uniref:hypothetical protein n=1 Tax=Streptomyces hayashii TaxID=2839966 RepID=UPI00403C9122
MNSNREQPTRSARPAQPAQPAQPAHSAQSPQSTQTTRSRQGVGRAVGRGVGRAGAARGPWTVLCAVAAVVLGPAAATASALEQANRAPLHHAVRIERPQAYIPADTARRRLAP